MGIVDFEVVIADVDADSNDAIGVGSSVKAVRFAGIAAEESFRFAGIAAEEAFRLAGIAVKEAIRLSDIAAEEVFELTATVLYIAWFVQDMLPSLDLSKPIFIQASLQVLYWSRLSQFSTAAKGCCCKMEPTMAEEVYHTIRITNTLDMYSE